MAKRAAVKLIAFWNRHKLEKKQQEADLKQKAIDEKIKMQEDEKAETLRRQNTSNRSKSRVSASSPAASARSQESKKNQFKLDGSQIKDKDGDRVNSQAFNVEGKNQEDHMNTQELEDAVISKLDGKHGGYKTISEESDSLKQSHRSSVEDFFAKTAHVPAANITSPAERAENGGRQGADPIMAFNDVRIVGLSRHGKNFKTYERNQVPKADPKRNNLLANGESVIKGEEKDLEVDADIQHDWILDELDFEKVIVQREDKAAAGDVLDYNDKLNQKQTPKREEDLYDLDHPLDLSFTRDKNYGKKAGGYASDNDTKHVKPDEESFSILSSNDESLNAKLNDNNISAIKPSKREERNSRVRYSKEVNNKLKRMLTSDFKDKNAMNDS